MALTLAPPTLDAAFEPDKLYLAIPTNAERSWEILLAHRQTAEGVTRLRDAAAHFPPPVFYGWRSTEGTAYLTDDPDQLPSSMFKEPPSLKPASSAAVVATTPEGQVDLSPALEPHASRIEARNRAVVVLEMLAAMLGLPFDVEDPDSWDNLPELAAQLFEAGDDPKLEFRTPHTEAVVRQLRHIAVTGHQHHNYLNPALQDCADVILALHRALARRTIEAELEARAAQQARDNLGNLAAERRDRIIQLEAVAKRVLEADPVDGIPVSVDALFDLKAILKETS